jgi:hypothetical protein
LLDYWSLTVDTLATDSAGLLLMEISDLFLQPYIGLVAVVLVDCVRIVDVFNVLVTHLQLGAAQIGRHV